MQSKINIDPEQIVMTIAGGSRPVFK